MISSSSLLSIIYKVGPGLLSVAKRTYRDKTRPTINQLGREYWGPLNDRVYPSLMTISSLQESLEIPSASLNDFFACSDFEVIVRRILAFQWTKVIESKSERDERFRRIRMTSTKFELAESVQIRKDKSGSEEVTSNSNALEDDQVDAVVRRISESDRALVVAATLRLLIERGVTFDVPQSRLLAQSIVEASSICSAVVWSLHSGYGYLAQDRTLISANARFLPDEIEALRRELKEELTVTPETYKEYERFLQRYGHAIKTAYRYVQHPDFSDLPTIDLNDIYVSPSFIESYPEAAPRNGLIVQDVGGDVLYSPQEVMESSYRTVVIGNPGAGKSTLARKLCLDLMDKHGMCAYAGRPLVPLLIELRDYASAKKDKKASIIEYVSNKIHADFQLDPPAGFLPRQFLAGRILVIFDGLDELLDASDRLNIRDSVHQFAELYPSVPILVTSREVGYFEAPLDPTRFSLFRLMPFELDQTRDYVQNWFRLLQHESRVKRLRLAVSFLRDTESIKTLRSNPLMLALLCKLYRRDRYFPQNRAAIYDRCADLLFERWDKYRQIVPSASVEPHIRFIMGYLAFWIYSDAEFQTGVTEHQLIDRVSEYLRGFYKDYAVARRFAREIVTFFNGRAWLFTDTGSNSIERLYQFTHQTFLEFFTAEHLASQADSAEELISTLMPHLVEGEWELVCQLALEILAKRYARRGSDHVLRGLLARVSLDVNRNSTRIYLFSVRMLQVLRPTIAVREEVLLRVVDLTLGSFLKKTTPQAVSSIDLKNLRNLVTALIMVPADDVHSVAQPLLTSLRSKMQGADVLAGALALEVCYGLTHHLQRPAGLTSSERFAVRIWLNELQCAITEFKSKEARFSEINVHLAHLLWWRRGLTMSFLIQHHGPETVLVDEQFGFEDRSASIASYLLASSLYGFESNERHIEDAWRDLVDSLQSHPGMWNEREVSIAAQATKASDLSPYRSAPIGAERTKVVEVWTRWIHTSK